MPEKRAAGRSQPAARQLHRAAKRWWQRAQAPRRRAWQRTTAKRQLEEAQGQERASLMQVLSEPEAGPSRRAAAEKSPHVEPTWTIWSKPALLVLPEPKASAC